MSSPRPASSLAAAPPRRSPGQTVLPSEPRMVGWEGKEHASSRHRLPMSEEHMWADGVEVAVGSRSRLPLVLSPACVSLTAECLRRPWRAVTPGSGSEAAVLAGTFAYPAVAH